MNGASDCTGATEAQTKESVVCTRLYIPPSRFPAMIIPILVIQINPSLPTAPQISRARRLGHVHWQIEFLKSKKEKSQRGEREGIENKSFKMLGMEGIRNVVAVFLPVPSSL